ncbi:alpha/beta hydrolase-fold protein [Psychrosphaera algicola]|uniref:alpha/beta hydrolase-fold protein n=1 Tax=Psychrosphaera algicola TaxID=3023714 RepID=UPI00351CE7B2
MGNIEKLIDIDFPQLQTKRDVWVYLPPSYQAESNTAFPVLYMMDGQNVFDKKRHTVVNGKLTRRCSKCSPSSNLVSLL